MKLNNKFTLTLLVSCVCCVSAYADGGVNTGYSPYSKFGIGRLSARGTAYNQSMGGVGVANRNNSFINVLNPAAVTARDTLAFMADFTILQENAYYKQGSKTSVDNTFNINNVTMSFPIWKSSAFMVGISPYSGLGYNFTEAITDKDIVGEVGNLSDYNLGTGSIYNAYLGAGVTFWKRLSLGAQFDFYFGNLSKSASRTFTSSEISSILNSTSMSLHGASGKFGIQYEQPIGKAKVIFGATYKTAAKLGGHAESLDYTYQGSYIDTLITNKTVNLDNISIPSEISVGLSFRYRDNLFIEMDYTRADWRKTGMDTEYGFKNDKFSTSVKQTYSLGAEYIPNKNDVRYYFRRCAYRIGAYYGDDYFLYDGNKVTTAAITLGVTLPVFRWSNGVSLGMEIGQKGNTRNNMIRETFVNFSVGINIYDIWFMKPRYE